MSSALPDLDETPRRKRVSRRSVLRLSAVGGAVGIAGAAGLLAGPLWVSADEIPDWTAADIPDQTGRRAIVTGGNGLPIEDRSGLGYHDALALARAGADVVIASRDAGRGEEAMRRIAAEAPAGSIRFARLDLADLTSVRDFSARLQAEGRPIDILVNNAGVMGRQTREVSVDGFERVFATNTLGHFALTVRLLPLLRRATQPRIVWVSSSRTAPALPFDDLQLERDYGYAAAYDNTKLANLLLAFELDRRSRAAGWNIASIASHPGVARTNLIPSGPGLDSAEGWRFRMLPFMFQSPSDGALPTLYAATSAQAASGGYFGPNGFGGIRGLPGTAAIPQAAKDARAAATLWAALESMGQVSLA